PLAFEPRGIAGEAPLAVHGKGDGGIDVAAAELRALCGPDVEILAPVPRRGVHEPGALLVADVVTLEQRYGEAVAERAQRVRAPERLQRVRSDAPQALECEDACRLEHPLRELVGKDEGLARLRPIPVRSRAHPIDAVGNPGAVADRPIAGQRPGRSGPD